MDGDFVEPPQSLRLWYAILDHYGVEVFHVRHADQVIDVGIVSLIAFEVWMRELPLLMRLPEKRNVQHVRLVRVDDAHLGARNHRRDEVLLNRVRVDTIIDFRKLALYRPSQLCLLAALSPWNPLTRYNSNSTESHAADCRTITIQSFITMSAIGHAALMQLPQFPFALPMTRRRPDTSP